MYQGNLIFTAQAYPHAHSLSLLVLFLQQNYGLKALNHWQIYDLNAPLKRVNAFYYLDLLPQYISGLQLILQNLYLPLSYRYSEQAVILIMHYLQMYLHQSFLGNIQGQ